MSSTLDIATWLAQRGMWVFPLRPGSKRPFANCAACKTGQCPATPCPCVTADQPCHGLLAATTDPAQIRRWWARSPRANVGINTGASRLVVLDLDRKDKAPSAAAEDVLTAVADGISALEAILSADNRAWPDTLTVQTPSEGRHLYFRCPGGLTVPSDATGRVGYQIDVRAEGGYVVAPGCAISAPPEATAGTYRRCSATVDIAALPQWLHTRVQPPARPVPAKTNAPNLGGIRRGEHAPGYWQTIWDAELGKVETREGERWRLVYNAARRLANLATHDHAPWGEHEAIDALVDAAITRRVRTGKPDEDTAARRNATRGWQRGTHDGPESLLGWGGAA